jgi:hypothetical protein
MTKGWEIQLAIALLVVASPAWAQFGSAGAPPTVPSWAATTSSVPSAGAGHGGFHSGRGNVVFLGQPWLDSISPQAGNTTYIVLQPPVTQPEKASAEPPQPVTPLLIEWQGNRFVRSGSKEMAGEQTGKQPVKKVAPEISSKTGTVQPAILIFRDGHRESVVDYSIVAGKLYTSADYVKSGTWMRTIHLSSLDLPQTLQANQDAGVPFVLPSAPNVVITRP